METNYDDLRLVELRFPCERAWIAGLLQAEKG